MVVIIFDLDDTLVNCKMKVPRQTYHMLNRFIKLNYKIAIISYNPLINLIIVSCQLDKYTNTFFI